MARDSRVGVTDPTFTSTSGQPSSQTPTVHTKKKRSQDQEQTQSQTQVKNQKPKQEQKQKMRASRDKQDTQDTQPELPTIPSSWDGYSSIPELDDWTIVDNYTITGGSLVPGERVTIHVKTGDVVFIQLEEATPARLLRIEQRGGKMVLLVAWYAARAELAKKSKLGGKCRLEEHAWSAVKPDWELRGKWYALSTYVQYVSADALCGENPAIYKEIDNDVIFFNSHFNAFIKRFKPSWRQRNYLISRDVAMSWQSDAVPWWELLGASEHNFDEKKKRDNKIGSKKRLVLHDTSVAKDVLMQDDDLVLRGYQDSANTRARTRADAKRSATSDADNVEANNPAIPSTDDDDGVQANSEGRAQNNETIFEEVRPVENNDNGLVGKADLGVSSQATIEDPASSNNDDWSGDTFVDSGHYRSRGQKRPVDIYDFVDEDEQSSPSHIDKSQTRQKRFKVIGQPRGTGEQYSSSSGSSQERHDISIGDTIVVSSNGGERLGELEEGYHTLIATRRSIPLKPPGAFDGMSDTSPDHVPRHRATPYKQSSQDSFSSTQPPMLKKYGKRNTWKK